MLRWTSILAVAGFLGAAIFYSPYIGVSGQTHWVCLGCPNVSMGGSAIGRFVRLTIGGGMLNATLFVIVGLFFRVVLRFVFGGGGARVAGKEES